MSERQDNVATVMGVPNLQEWWEKNRRETRDHWFMEGLRAESTFLGDFTETLLRRTLSDLQGASDDLTRARQSGAAHAYTTILRLLGRTGA